MVPGSRGGRLIRLLSLVTKTEERAGATAVEHVAMEHCVVPMSSLIVELRNLLFTVCGWEKEEEWERRKGHGPSRPSGG